MSLLLQRTLSLYGTYSNIILYYEQLSKVQIDYMILQIFSILLINCYCFLFVAYAPDNNNASCKIELSSFLIAQNKNVLVHHSGQQFKFLFIKKEFWHNTILRSKIQNTLTEITKCAHLIVCVLHMYVHLLSSAGIYEG